MRVRPFLAAAAIAAVAAILTAPSAGAAWQVVSENTGGNADEPSHVRGADGTLHIVYRDHIGVANEGVRYRTLSPTGVLGAPTSPVAGWVSVTQPDIELVGGNPVAFWGGQQDTNSTNPRSTGQAWYSTLAGGAWSLSEQPLTASTTPYASTQFSTALASDGLPWSTWTQTGQLNTHAGLGTAGAEQNLSTGCCEYAANLGRDAATGDLYVNYFSNVTGRTGYYSRRIAPALGDAVLLAGGQANGNALSRTRRMSAAERTTGGVYSAHCDTYPSCTGIRVSAIGGRALRKPLTAAQVPTVPDSTWVAAAPLGRLWLSWSNRSGVYAVRSNRALTRWGAVQRLALPAGTDTSWQTSGEGSRGFLDLFSNITVGNATRIYTQRVKPPLTLTVSPTAVRNSTSHVVRFQLTDAGDPVGRGRVRFRGVTRTTNIAGYASFVVAAGSRAAVYGAVGTAPGYLDSSAVAVRIIAPRS